MTDTIWTVIGFWDEDEPVVVGIVAGRHDVVGGEGVSEQGPWAVSVTAPGSDKAGLLAVAEMAATLLDEEEDGD